MNDPASPGKRGPARFADLGTRLTSAAGMLVLGAVALWFGGWVFEILVVLIAGAMTWELSRLGAPERPKLALVIGASTGFAVAAAAGRIGSPDASILLLGPALILITPRRDSLLGAAWTGLVSVAAVGLIEARSVGFLAVLWLVGIVIISDASGYFAGRSIGGPKFWPQLSPKKTWSGTVAGWLGATVWSLLLLHFVGAEPFWLLVALAPVFAMAGQLSDIGESWIKRRAGVKDSSNLIPGHGGLMDRFDAISGAAALFMALEWLHVAQLGG